MPMLWPMPFERQFKGAIDQYSVFENTTQRMDYLNNPLRYAGQIVSQKDTGEVFVINATETAYIPIGGNTSGIKIIEDYDTLIAQPTPVADEIFYVKKDSTTDLSKTKGFYLYDLTNATYIILSDVKDTFSETDGIYQDFLGIPKGTSIYGKTDHEVLQDALFPVVPPEIVLTPKDTVYEIGSTVGALSIKADVKKTKFPIEQITINADGSDIFDDNTASNVKDGGSFTTSYTVPTSDTDSVITCTAKAGSTTGTKTSKITFARNTFYGTDSTNNTAYTTSAEVRALGGTKLGAKAGDVVTINIPTGAKMVVVAVPDTLSITSVKYVEGMNAEIKDVFAQTTVAVEGANGYTSATYKLYSYIPVVDFSTNVTYKVTLG